MWLDKAETWALADHYGHLDTVRQQTLTCYNGIAGDGCGACPACDLRGRGLQQYLADKAGVTARLHQKPGWARKADAEPASRPCLGYNPRLLQPAVTKMHYPINEIFQTIQGRGLHRPARHLRSPAGLPGGCPWCDTRHTWVVDPAREVGVQAVLDCSNESDGWSKMSTEQILASFQPLGYQARHVVITGEPCLYDLQNLSAALIEAGYQVQIETSGTSEIQTHELTWVTVSPRSI